MSKSPCAIGSVHPGIGWRLMLATISVSLLLLVAGCSDDAAAPDSPSPEDESPITGFEPASGPVGTTVTITGAGFSSSMDSNVVRFGPEAAAIVSVNDSVLVVTVPKGARSGRIAVSSGDVIGVSGQPFAVLWTELDSPQQVSAMYDVCWTGTQFVAVGQMGTIMTSPDGVDWTLQSRLTEFDLRAVAAGSGIIVAVGDDSTAVTYTPGQGWQRWFLPDDGFTDVAASPVGFFATPSAGGYILTSSDGRAWQTHPLDSLRPLSLAVYTDRMVVFSQACPVFLSTDGLQWSTVNSNLTYPEPIAAAWSGSRIIIAKPYSLLTTNAISTGIWDDTSPSGSNLRTFSGITWTGSYFLAIADEALWSAAGTGWALHSNFGRTSSVRPSLACNDEVCVLVGGYGGKVLLWWFAK